MHGEVNQSPEMVQQLLRFQRTCMTFGWFAMLMRVVRVVRRVVRPGSQEEKEIEADLSIGSLEEASGASGPPAYPAPPRRSSILGGYGPLFPGGPPPIGKGLPSGVAGEEDPEAEPFSPEELRELEAREQKLQARERRRREIDLMRGRAALRRMAESEMVQELQEAQQNHGLPPGLERPPLRSGLLRRFWRWFFTHL